MLKIPAILLLIYFLSGTIFLPQGDFSTLPDMPKMYVQCKNVEDTDMDLSDFITEHLMDINGIFGIEEHDVNDKPHQPIQLHHHLAPITFAAQQIKIEFCLPDAEPTKAIATANNICLSDYTANVFRPPIA